MSADISKIHVLVFPEDLADQEIANGFRGHDFNNGRSQRQIQVERVGKGWRRVCESFRDDYVSRLRRISTQHVLLLIDFDRKPGRRVEVEKYIPDDLKDRVFVLGVWSRPEDLRNDQKLTFEGIGRKLREDCPQQPEGIWGHELLKHNADEVVRMSRTLGAIISGD